MLEQLTNLFTNEALLGSAILVGLISVIILTIIDIVNYKKVPYISLSIIIVITVLAVIFGNKHIVIDIVFDVLFLGTIAFSVIEVTKVIKMSQAVNQKANQFLGNVAYDYYFSTNKKDIITSASESYMELVSLDLNELKKSKGFQTMLGEMKILKINNREVSEEVALKFLFDYEKNHNKDALYQFDLEVLIDEQNVLLKGIIEPIYYQNKFLGRNVYLINDQSATFNNLKNTIKKMVNDLEMDQKQMYALMSLTRNAIMYFDYKTRTYVATEAMNNYLEINQKEFTIEEFFDMIHPEDLRAYQEQGAMINSMMPNHVKLRLYINKKYYDVVDDAIYLSKDSKLVSIISLVGDPEMVSVKKQKEIVNENMWADLEESNPTDIMNDLLNEIKKDDNNE